MISSQRALELSTLAGIFLESRRTATPVTSIPEALEPQSLEEAWFVQDRMAEVIEPKGSVPARSWKIGASSPDSTPNFSQMIAAWIAPSGVIYAGERLRLRGLEAEVAFKLGNPLPPRATPYTREEVIAAIESCHPVIEELEAALPVLKDAPKNRKQADLGMHGGFIYGPAVANWQQIDLTKENVTLTVAGVEVKNRTASNSAGTDLIRMIVFLANEGAARTGGLEAGSWITTGSWTGNDFAQPGDAVEVKFSTVGTVSMSFA